MPSSPEDKPTAGPDGGRPSIDRDAARRQRRRGDQQFLGLILIGAVVFFAIGLGIAKVIRRPKPTAVSAPVSAAKTASPPQSSRPPAAPKANAGPPGATKSEGTPPGAPAADKPAFNIQTRPPIPTNDRQAYVDAMVKWRREDPKYLAQKWERYQKALELGDLKVDRVKQAFLATPREKFCRSWNLDQAYAHAYLDIHYGVTISGPHIVCRMTNALNPQPYHRCLEIGTGSGYQAAVLAELSNRVYSIEIIAPLLQETQVIYDQLVQEGWEEYRNVHLKAADGYYGWKEHAPFDRIVVTCAIDHIPPPLLEQLAPNGIMVIPIGSPGAQRVLKVTKTVDASGQVHLARQDLYPGRTKPIQFVPFTKEGGGTHFR